jgi:hypothetical protein
MATKFDSRQVVSLDALNQLTGNAADIELDNILRSADSELSPILQLSTDSVRTISISSPVKLNPETARYTSLGPINGALSAFTGGTVQFPSITGDSITITPGSPQTLTMSINSFMKIGIHLEDSGNLLVSFGTESGTVDGTGTPPALPNSVAIGYVVLSSDGAGAVNTVDISEVYQYVGAYESLGISNFQDRNIKMIGGGTWTWDDGDLSLSASAYIQVPGLDDTSNEIVAQSITLSANEIAYVTLNRSTNTPTVLSVSTANINAVPQNNNNVIIARRDGTDILVGTSSFRLKEDERLELDGALAELARRLDQLKLVQDPLNADQVTISGADITQLDGTTLSQELNNVLMDFAGATINFSTGIISGDANGIDFAPFSVPVGEYFWYGIAIVGDTVGLDNRIGASIQVTPATASDAVQANAELPLIIGSKKLGAIQVWNNGGTIEVVDIKRLGVGSGSGGEGEGSGAPVEPASGFNMAFSDNFDVGPTGADSLVDGAITNAGHNLSKGFYKLDCDSTPVFTGAGTNITLSVAPTFTVQEGDIIYIDLLNEWRRITTVNNQQDFDVDTAFSLDPSAGAGLISQAVWTKDLINNVGDASQSTRPRDFYPGEEISVVHLDYFDSLAVDDDVPDFTDSARVVASVSQEGLQNDVGLPPSDKFTSIFTRPQAPNQILNYPLIDTGDKQRLFVVFFCNPNNVSVATNGSANLLKYKVSFYEDETLSNGGILDSAFCMSDGSGTEVNCLAPTVLGGKTYITLDWFYIGGVNSGETQGDLTVLVNGQEMPRYIAGVTLDAYYEEVPGNNRQIRFYTDLSVSAVSIEVYRRQGSIDTSDQNAQDLANIQQSLLINSSTTLDRKKYQRVITDSSSGAFTINLPSNPLPGDIVKIQDGTASWTTFNVTLGRNGNLIETTAADDILDLNRGWIEYEYYNAIQGWITRT